MKNISVYLIYATFSPIRGLGLTDAWRCKAQNDFVFIWTKQLFCGFNSKNTKPVSLIKGGFYPFGTVEQRYVAFFY